MSLHQIAEELLPEWVKWSAQSNSFQQGHAKKSGQVLNACPVVQISRGRGMKTLRAMAKEDGWVDLGGYTAFTIDELRQKVQQQQTPDQEMLDGLIQSLTMIK